MNKNKSLFLHILQENKPSEKSIKILESDIGYFRVPVVIGDELIPQKKGWRIFLLDSRGIEISNHFVASDDKLRVEIFNPESGQIEEVRDEELPIVNLHTVIPYPDSVEKIKIVEVDPLLTYHQATTSLMLNRKDIEVISATKCKGIENIYSPITYEVMSKEDRTINRPLIIALMGDGYTQNDMEKWKKDSEKIMTGFFSDPLMFSLKNRFRFIRLNLISKDSGISQERRNTALHMVLKGRLLTICSGLAKQAANNVLGYGEYDQILAVGNTEEYGGAGYPDEGIATLTIHSSATELALHEFGHSAYGLADEYVYVCESTNCKIDSEPSAPNITIETNRNKIKWRHHIKPETQIPTREPKNGVIGLFEGAASCKTGLYRPVYNSKMRNLYQRWYAVNEEHIRKVMDAYSGKMES
ncbi:M64 family metallopeptidase [Xenorhabdus sp. PB62.4]|uniref:M64 family metallopeptidase n=1 Tax=Xenorhabdus sp. PB62.4 TaxID=1851573 RepID=UPI001CA46B7C|nr:M64 family metallopeptidase [Xenorhabdus sp. PB62.4]MBC8953192.1 hypothetical protein [Xenorhabdus sp. PB62.4]